MKVKRWSKKRSAVYSLGNTRQMSADCRDVGQCAPCRCSWWNIQRRNNQLISWPEPDDNLKAQARMQSNRTPIFFSGSSEARRVPWHRHNPNHEGKSECELGFPADCDRKGMHDYFEERTFSWIPDQSMIQNGSCGSIISSCVTSRSLQL